MYDPRIVHIFSQNVDESYDNHITPIPIGISPLDFPRFDNTYPKYYRKDYNADFLWNNWERNISFAVKQYNHKVLRIDKELRHDNDSPTSITNRQKVSSYCDNEWKEYCISAAEEFHQKGMKGLGFHQRLSDFTFVLCVQGEGIDPNAIPIISHFPGDSMYEGLPIAYIDGGDWNIHSISKDKLDTWLRELRIFYEDPVKREIVLEKLTSDYWWKKIEEKTKFL